jgi:hypothetical protein
MLSFSNITKFVTIVINELTSYLTYLTTHRLNTDTNITQNLNFIVNDS